MKNELNNREMRRLKKIFEVEELKLIFQTFGT